MDLNMVFLLIRNTGERQKDSDILSTTTLTDELIT